MKISKLIAVAVLSVLAVPSIALAVAPSVPTLNPVNQENLLVTGLTDNDSEVVVYIDDEFIGMATVSSEGTSSNNYFFSVHGILESGDHSVRVAAKDKQSRSLSDLSGIEKFSVSEENSFKEKILIEPTITIEAAVENVEQVEGEKTEEANELFDINELVAEEEEMSDEDKAKNENILRWNLGIFIFFLVAVIGWIIWVNRELKKEKEAEEKNNK